MFPLNFYKWLNPQRRQFHHLEKALIVAQTKLKQLCLNVSHDVNDAQKKRARIIGLTARTQGEGVTTLSCGLAITLASQIRGKLLLVLTDDDPVQQEMIKAILKLSQAGQTHQQSNDKVHSATQGTKLEHVHFSNRFGFDVLLPQDLSQLSMTSDHDAFVSELALCYDCIVIDAGPWSEQTARAWTTGIDEMLLVVDTSTTTQEKLFRFRQEMEQTKSAINWRGVIMNKRRFPIPNFLYPLLS